MGKSCRLPNIANRGSLLIPAHDGRTSSRVKCGHPRALHLQFIISRVEVAGLGALAAAASESSPLEIIPGVGGCHCQYRV